MKNHTLILMISIVALCTGIIFSSIIGLPPGKEKHSLAGVMQKDTIHRFGVDGTTLKYAKKIAEIGDDWSGIGGLKWNMVEPQPPKDGKHFYDWTKTDRFIRTFQTTGRKLQINIRIYNDWAVEYSAQNKVTDAGTGQKVGVFVRIKPKHLLDWAAFITAFVERYDADGNNDMPGLKYPVTHIQIESEAENVWVDADGYTEALCAAYGAAKKASSNIQIMAAGFNMFDFFALSQGEQRRLLRNPFIQHKVDFLKGFFSKAGACFDILSLHLNRDYESIPATVKWFQQQMEDNGYKKPIWSEDTSSGPFLMAISTKTEGKAKLNLLEQGDTKTTKWFREEQAKLLVKKAVISFASGVDKVFISTDMDWPTYYMPMWRHMGLLDANGNLKPAFYSFKTMVSKIDGFTNVERLALGADVFAYCFTKPSGKVYVLWSEQEKVVNLPLKSKSINVTDISGITLKVSPLKLRISTSPVFVEEK
jgi:hypothetical protein